jgi:hypothetical protein
MDDIQNCDGCINIPLPSISSSLVAQTGTWHSVPDCEACTKYQHHIDHSQTTQRYIDVTFLTAFCRRFQFSVLEPKQMTPHVGTSHFLVPPPPPPEVITAHISSVLHVQENGMWPYKSWWSRGNIKVQMFTFKVSIEKYGNNSLPFMWSKSTEKNRDLSGQCL